MKFKLLGESSALAEVLNLPQQEPVFIIKSKKTTKNIQLIECADFDLSLTNTYTKSSVYDLCTNFKLTLTYLKRVPFQQK